MTLLQNALLAKFTVVRAVLLATPYRPWLPPPYRETYDKGLNVTPHPSSPQNNDIYSVNSMAFHPEFGTFVTAGSDGTFNFWDKDSKQRLKAMSKCAYTADMPAPITAGARIEARAAAPPCHACAMQNRRISWNDLAHASE